MAQSKRKIFFKDTTPRSVIRRKITGIMANKTSERVPVESKQIKLVVKNDKKESRKKNEDLSRGQYRK